ncbi:MULTISPECIES: TetR/AcrR family transcriptional regulator [Bacteroides]|uniref:TetR/AcrR family transcriptional regulator n=1 Tax=Bacteroides gallinaceum TaxID=1462571 RepID=A0ABT7VFC3_9BACE|nr:MULTISPECIES: TetR/AcrR family transcriptional regulator [Bacteroides]MCR8918505.1 TetR/AcrR family transcriptional regulator [Bacteroides sp. ET225]MDM8324993.1 TetR/AcrR family transcriptional regulator [Bacteroides gallinaceum]
MNTDNNDNLEQKIIDTAREIFIEKGFTDTSMSEIAAKVGMNRPGIHYYFRTKDRMFQAVFGNIVLSFIPQIKDIIQNKEKPISQRIREIVDAYYRVFKENPYLPLFMLKEINRDVSHLIAAIEQLGVKQYMTQITDELQDEMAEGRLRSVPLRIVFMNFYSLLTVPFLTRDLCGKIFINKEKETFDTLLEQWKIHIVSQMTNLLEPTNN